VSNRALLDATVSEAAFQEQVIEYATFAGGVVTIPTTRGVLLLAFPISFFCVAA
jgi:hypothetical protein